MAETAETRPLITVCGKELSHNLGRLSAEIAAGAVIRWVDLRTRRVVGFISAECPQDVADVADDGIPERLPPRDITPALVARHWPRRGVAASA